MAVPRSVCPVCLRPIPARYETVGLESVDSESVDSETVLIKQCPEHGEFRAVVWRGEPAFSGWLRPKVPSAPGTAFTEPNRGCPLDCGLCSAHRQHTCTAVLEITWRCDLGCPVCFASSGTTAPPDPTRDEIAFLLDRVHLASGHCNLQFSGGEPTMRNDLPQVIRLAKDRGFPFVQLNTNGLRLAREPGYARKLAEAGLDSAFLQFDGLENSIYQTLRGRGLLEDKLVAVERLGEAGIGVVLVPTVVPGVNDHNLGDILEFGAAHSPVVRGVHFQPVSYFGRYPAPPRDEQRITLPQIMRRLEEQSGAAVRATDFLPPGCEHALCSFHANYLVTEQGGLQRLSASGCGCTPPTPQGAAGGATAPEIAQNGADKAKAFVRRQWAGAGKPSGKDCCTPTAKGVGKNVLRPMAELDLDDFPDSTDDLDRFIARAATHTLAVSAMAFQDAWTLDLERLRGCCIHVVAPDGRLVPFCAYNLTSMSGETLYRGHCHATAAS